LKMRGAGPGAGWSAWRRMWKKRGDGTQRRMDPPAEEGGRGGGGGAVGGGPTPVAAYPARRAGDSRAASVDGRQEPLWQASRLRPPRRTGSFASSLAESAVDALRSVTGHPPGGKYHLAVTRDDRGGGRTRGRRGSIGSELDGGGAEGRPRHRRGSAESGGSGGSGGGRAEEGSFAAHVDRASRLRMAW
jgi:hypothetical protein